MTNLMEKYGWNTWFLPMNAKEAGKKKDTLLDSQDYIAEHKYDGSRYWSLDGRFFSRKLSSKTGLPIEKTANVPHLSAELENLPEGTILDGEIYYPNATSAKTTNIMGAAPAKAIARQKDNPIRYVVFDITMYQGKDISQYPWLERRSILEDVYAKYLYEAKYIDLTEVIRENKRDFLKKMISTGQEGIMLKNIQASYVPDKRPENHWYKVKKNMTDDVIIIGYTEGQGRYENQIGSIIFGKHEKRNGEIVELGSCSGFPDALRKKITANPDAYMNLVIEISAMEETEAGFYRHPQFKQLRTDKGPEACIIKE